MLTLSRRSALSLLALLGLTACGSHEKKVAQATSSAPSTETSTSPSAESSSVQKSQVDTGVRTDSGYHLNTLVEGAPTVTLYTDMQCPYCAEAEPAYRQAATLLDGTMNLTVRNFPLPKHTNALPAAQAVQAAEKQGAHMAMVEQIFTHQDDWKKVQDTQQLTQIFSGYAESLGLDVDRFKNDLSDQDQLKLIKSEFEAGKSAGVPGTPTFMVDGTICQDVDSSTPAQAMVEAFKKQAGL